VLRFFAEIQEFTLQKSPDQIYNLAIEPGSGIALMPPE